MFETWTNVGLYCGVLPLGGDKTGIQALVCRHCTLKGELRRKKSRPKGTDSTLKFKNYKIKN